MLLFNMTEEQYRQLPYRQAVDVVIINENTEVLLLQKQAYSETDWALAGGGIDEADKSELDAVARELAEETGIKSFTLVGKSSHLNQYDFPFNPQFVKQDTKFRGQQKAVYVVSVANNIEVVLQLEEIRTYRWVKPLEALEMMHFPNQKEVFTKIFTEFNLI